MGPEDRRGGRWSADDELVGRDLLVGRPQGAEGRPGAGTEQSPTAATSSQAGAQDEGTREILQTVRAMAAKIDVLLSATGPESETAQALKREIAALTRSVEDARGSLAETAKLAARREKKASSEASVVSQAIAALKAQGAVLKERIQATREQAKATDLLVSVSAGQAKTAAEGVTKLKDTAEALEKVLNDHAENVSRATKRLRWRPWLMGLALGAASFIFFAVGAVSQREIDVLSLGDPRREWNEHVVERFAPLLAACAAKARLEGKPVRCGLTIVPTRKVAIPLYTDVIMTDEAPQELPDLTLDR